MIIHGRKPGDFVRVFDKLRAVHGDLTYGMRDDGSWQIELPFAAWLRAGEPLLMADEG